MNYEKASVMEYRTLFEASGINHSNSGLQKTHDIYINVYLMLFFDFTPDRSASAGDTSHPGNGNNRQFRPRRFFAKRHDRILKESDGQLENSVYNARR